MNLLYHNTPRCLSLIVYLLIARVLPIDLQQDERSL